MAKNGDASEAQFRKVLDGMLERTPGERPMQATTKEWLGGWLRGKELAKAAGTHLRYGNTVQLFIESLGERATKNLANTAILILRREGEKDGRLGVKIYVFSTGLTTHFPVITVADAAPDPHPRPPREPGRSLGDPHLPHRASFVASDPLIP
jgi:hypothetical protein